MQEQPPQIIRLQRQKHLTILLKMQTDEIVGVGAVLEPTGPNGLLQVTNIVYGGAAQARYRTFEEQSNCLMSIFLDKNLSTVTRSSADSRRDKYRRHSDIR